MKISDPLKEGSSGICVVERDEDGGLLITNLNTHNNVGTIEVSGIRMPQKLARTIQNLGEGLLAWYDHPISTGLLEGTNNKIRTMQRQAYGFRDQEFFILIIHALQCSNFASAG